MKTISYALMISCLVAFSSGCQAPQPTSEQQTQVQRFRVQWARLVRTLHQYRNDWYSLRDTRIDEGFRGMLRRYLEPLGKSPTILHCYPARSIDASDFAEFQQAGSEYYMAVYEDRQSAEVGAKAASNGSNEYAVVGIWLSGASLFLRVYLYDEFGKKDGSTSVVFKVLDEYSIEHLKAEDNYHLVRPSLQTS